MDGMKTLEWFIEKLTALASLVSEADSVRIGPGLGGCPAEG